MINNRQAGRRNRGRNNGRQNGGNRGGDSGNRIDSRARGNAPQLLEKYRNMARDAQLAGDRVNTEYYLQFADHYFRVIADNRARQEEQQARFRRNDEPLDDENDGPDADEAMAENGADENEDGEADVRRERRPRRMRIEVNRRPEPGAGETGAGDDAAAPAAEARPQDEAADEAPKRRTPRTRKPRKAAEDDAAPQGLDIAALPPAIARADNDGDGGEEEEAAPRRRGRRPRASAEAAE